MNVYTAEFFKRYFQLLVSFAVFIFKHNPAQQPETSHYSPFF